MFTKQRKLIQIGMVVVVIVAALSATGIVFAQASANFDLGCWAILSSGGGEMNISIEGEPHTLVSALGQWYGSDTLPDLNDPSRRVVLFSGYIQNWDWLQPPTASLPLKVGPYHLSHPICRILRNLFKKYATVRTLESCRRTSVVGGDHSMPYVLRPVYLALAVATAAILALAAQPLFAANPAAAEPILNMAPLVSFDIAPLQQETQQVYALPGRLRRAQDQPFSTYLVTNDGNIYGLVGETPAVEEQIVAYRDAGPDVEVKVWGTLYPEGRSSDSPEIVVSSIQLADLTQVPASTPPPGSTTPQVTVKFQSVNLRAGPGTDYAAVGELSINQSCDIIGRNADSSWWQVRCPDGSIGWVSNDVVNVSGSTGSVSVVGAAPPPPQPPTAAPTATPPPPLPPTATPAPAAPSQPAYNSWQANYWNNTNLTGNPVASRPEARDQYPLDRNWGGGSPIPGVVNNDYFSARWVGSFYFDHGDYQFQTNVDDGARIYIDGIMVVNAWSDGYKDVGNTFNGIGAGNHEVKVEYYERTGGASIRVWWWRVNHSGGGGGSSGSRNRDE